MQQILLGEEINGYSSTIRHGYEDVRLHLGRANSARDDRYVASFELFGISVLVTDQATVDNIVKIWRLNERDKLVDYLKKVLLECLSKDLTVITDMMKEEYQRGVQAGQKEKAEEIRKAIMAD